MTTPLITRLEEAAEGSRELDALVWLATNPTGEIDVKRTGRTLAPVWRCRSPGASRSNSWFSPEPVTTSFDFAYALAGRVLPEMNCFGFDKTPHGVEAYVSRNNVYAGHWFVTGEHPSSPAIALCIAILKANHKDKP